MKQIETVLLLALLPLAVQTASWGSTPPLTLAEGFKTPPESTQPWCYWYWISDNISKEGITHDLEAMHRFGIGQAIIGNVDANPEARGQVKVLSEEWWGLVEHAVREGGRVGVKVGLFNCPGWSQSGGPWIKPEQAMRYVALSETRLAGPVDFHGKLPPPAEPFQDIAVLAFPAPRDDAGSISTRRPRITCEPEARNAEALIDGKLDTVCQFPARAGGRVPFVVNLEVAEPFTARSLVLHPAPQPFRVNCELLAADANGKFQTVRQFALDRGNTNLNVGFLPFGPVAVAFPPVTSHQFRLVFTGLAKAGGLAEIELTGAMRVERYVEKQLGKMFQRPHPLWDAYLWPPASAAADPPFAVAPNQVLNLTHLLAADGTLRWKAPPGDWVVLRAGMTPTGVRNAPASPEATGYEVDKMSRKWVAAHFDAYVGELLRRMPASERPALHRVIADSYETGGQNWTDGLAADFKNRYGYDPLLWLPVLTGRIVGSADESDRFLWDLRRLVADRIARDYVGGLREECQKRGMRLWLENYGHWGFPAEFLQYGGQSDDIGGEFWTSGELGSIELRAASSAAHVYGKQVVSAEAFTSGGPHWQMDPWWQKEKCDWAATEGINHFVLHVYIHQPSERAPGINAEFGTEFNRLNTWFEPASGWVDYVRRTHFLLQQGKYVADLAYFIGEDAPKMTGVCKPALPPGFSFDYVNAEVIEQKMQVKDGAFILASGMSYRLLVLPELETMRPELLRQISRLVQAGGAVLGPPPSRSPSLEHYPACDREVRELAAELWRGCDGQQTTHVRRGKGHVFRGVDAASALATLGVAEDVSGLDRATFPWVHRSTTEGDLYFLSHQGDAPQVGSPSFRVSGRQPELWDAVTGQHRLLPDFREEHGRTTVSLQFAPRQSLFVVFRHPAEHQKTGTNFPALATLCELTGPWTVQFDPKWGGPESVQFDSLADWTTRPEEGIKYYSGKAIYRKGFDLPGLLAGDRLYLDLGQVRSLATVRLNGQALGLVWCAPWRVDISAAARASGNQLELEVYNTWANRLTGDAVLPPEKRLTWTAVLQDERARAKLLPSGLMGPVSVLREQPPMQ